MLRWAVLAVVLVAGCFAESPLDQGEGGTGDPGCAIGSEGCMCTAGDGCDGTLECLQPAGVCVQPGCTPGTGLCSCADGSCAAGYECTQNFCAPMQSTTDTGSTTIDPTASDASTAPAETSETVTASSSGSVADDGGEAEATGEPSSDGGDAESSSTGAPPSCHDCLLDAQLGSCADEYDECPACEGLSMCVLGGESTPAECCAELASTAVPAGWNTFATCVDTQCALQCESLVCEGS